MAGRWSRIKTSDAAQREGSLNSWPYKSITRPQQNGRSKSHPNKRPNDLRISFSKLSPATPKRAKRLPGLSSQLILQVCCKDVPSRLYTLGPSINETTSLGTRTAYSVPGIPHGTNPLVCCYNYARRDKGSVLRLLDKISPQSLYEVCTKWQKKNNKKNTPLSYQD